MSKGYSGLSGRGSQGGIVEEATKSRFKNVKINTDSGSSEAQASKNESKKQMPTSGAKVQESFIEYVKKQTGINLASARDTQFDTRRFFNVDTRQLGKNDLPAIKRLLQNYDGGYDVIFGSNGAYRIAIHVKRKK